MTISDHVCVCDISNNDSVPYKQRFACTYAACVSVCVCVCLHLIAHLRPRCTQCTFFPVSRWRSTSHLHGERKTHERPQWCDHGASKSSSSSKLIWLKKLDHDSHDINPPSEASHQTSEASHRPPADRRARGKRHAFTSEPSSARTSHLFNSFLIAPSARNTQRRQKMFLVLSSVSWEYYWILVCKTIL